MRCFLSQRIPKEPAVHYVQANFLGGSSQRWDTVNMLYYCRLKQPTGSALGLP